MTERHIIPELVTIMPHKLRELRAEAGLSQAQVAAKVGIGRSGYTRIECGDRLPSLRLAQRIAAVFSRTVEDIFPAAEHQEPANG